MAYGFNEDKSKAEIKEIKTKTIHPIISQTTIQANSYMVRQASFSNEEMEGINTIIAYKSVRFVNSKTLQQMFLIASWIDDNVMLISNPTGNVYTVKTGDIEADIVYI